MNERSAAGAALGGAVLSVLTLHALEPGLDPLRRFMSEYALTAHGALMRVAFVLLASAGALLARSERAAPSRAVSIGLGTWSLGMALAGAFVTDASVPEAVRTTHGLVHDLGADLAFAGAVLAASASSARGRLAAATMVIAASIGPLLALPGLGQRAFALAAVGWMTTLVRRPG